MASEYGLELLDKVQRDFAKYYANDSKIKKLTKKIANNSQNYEDANEYAIRVGELASKALTNHVKSNDLNYISRELAEDVLKPTLTTDYELISNAIGVIQANKNKASNISLEPQIADLDTNRIDGLINKIASYETLDQGEYLLKEPVVNYSQAVVDDSIRKNAKVQAKAGLTPKIRRVAESGACRWCRALEGVYEPQDAPDNIYRRHEFCRCTVTYENGKERQDVWSKTKWEVEEEQAQIEKLEKAIEEKEKAIEKDLQKTPYENKFLQDVKANSEVDNFYYKEVKEMNKPQTVEQIVNKIAGGDLTMGSCQSLAIAYTGNKCGYDVIDYRGGGSLNFFAKHGRLKDLSNLNGIVSYTEKNKNGIKGAVDVLKKAEENKEYIFSAGKHTAIVKKSNGKYFYLELQSGIESENGYQQLSTDLLKKRFGVTKSQTLFGEKIEQEAFLIEVDSFKGNDTFKEILGYINTNVDEQQKGANGVLR